MSSGITDGIVDTDLEVLLADEVWEGFGVVIETWSGVVCATCAAEAQGGGITGVIADIATAESTASVLLTLAPLASDGEGDDCWVEVESAVLRSNEAGTCEQSNADGGLEEHLDD